MANTLNIAQDPGHGKRIERRMRTLLPLLIICLLALSSNGMSFVTSSSHLSFAQGNAQKSFDKLKTLEGIWEGSVATVPREAEVEGKLVQVSLRVTSRGNALMHEMRISGIPDDPITMFYVDGDSLLLTHYCDAGNRPRMEGKVSPDGKSLEFDFLDVAGGTQHGHMHHTMFTIIDANHHTEDWTYMNPSGKAVHAHYDLRRTK